MAESLVIAMPVATPGGHQQIVRLEQLAQVIDQERLVTGQGAILEVEAAPIQAVEVQVQLL
ncbi:hypothetical protein D3C71_2037570 [compost metagenome]